ncbi:MAG: GatB/YqeY domain-containing protein [Deltaproteobacteria bacterium]
MGIKERVSGDIVHSMKAGEKERTSTLRMLLSAIKNKEIELRPRAMTEEEGLQVVSTLIRQRLDSVEQFTKGGRNDLADKELKEIELLKAYQPQQLSEDEVKSIVRDAIKALGATGIKDMGAVMKTVTPKTKARAEGKLVNDIVRQTLGG